MFEKILVPLDGSEHSIKALKVAHGKMHYAELKKMLSNAVKKWKSTC